MGLKRNSPTTVGAYLLLVFLSGALVGAFGHRLYSANTVNAKAPAPNHEEFRKRYLREMESRLSLDGAQMQSLNTILDETKALHKAVHDRMDPEMKKIQLDQRNKIRGMLKDSQRAEYEKMIEEKEKKRKQENPGGGC